MFTFAKRKKSVELRPYVRRICDLTAPNLPVAASDRAEDRCNRTIPTLICPWDGERPDEARLSTCLTSNLSDRGVQLVLTHPFSADRVVLGYLLKSDQMGEPWFFLGDVRRNQAIGGGFWAVGIELTEFANAEHRAALAGLVEAGGKLVPPKDLPC